MDVKEQKNSGKTDMYEIDSSIYDSFRHEKNPMMAEKDYLECVILERLFSEPFFKNNFVFAGGGTITKIYKIGNRIGQDVDLAFTDFEDLPNDRSVRKLNKFKNNFNEFVFNDLNTSVTKTMKDIGDFTVLTDRQVRASQPEAHAHTQPALYVNYSSNLNPRVEKCITIEFIPRHYDVQSLDTGYVIPYSIGELMPVQIPTVHYSQTFWDKVYALHTINQIGMMRSGLAHHYYDVANLIPCVKLKQTKSMFKSIEKYQQTYTTRKMATVESISDINLMPNDNDNQRLSLDYQNMSNRFIGRMDSWKSIMTILDMINKSIHNLNNGEEK